MSTSLFSSSWYRVAGLRPMLRAQARIVRHTYRGERWHVVQDLTSGHFLRFNSAAYSVIALMDGVRTLEEIWLDVSARLGDKAPTQDEILHLMTQLYQAHVLHTDQRPDLQDMAQRGQRSRRARFKQYLANPLSLKFALLDPEHWFGRWVGAITPRLWRIVMGLWALLVVSALVQVGMHWDELTADMTSHIFTPDNLFILWLVFPLLKGIHELGHFLALKAVGSSSREMGLMFQVMVPVPYVDATQSTGLANKWQRILVSLAGMMTELGVASIAVWLWLAVAPGPIKAVLHQVILLAGLTTLVFNANPLLRFDGYYALADWLEIPNLGQKANRWVIHLVRRHLFGMLRDVPPALTPGEGRWLLTYAVAAQIYKAVVTVSIILFVAEHYFVVGVLLALWVGWSFAIQPFVKLALWLTRDAAVSEKRIRAISVSTGVLGLLGLLLFVLPAPAWTVTEGVIWMSEQSRIRTPVACFGESLLQPSGTRVQVGQPVIRCRDEELDAQLAQESARVQEQNSRLTLAIKTDRVHLQLAQAELTHEQARLANISTRHGDMVMRATHAGTFVMPAPTDFPGRYLNRGDVVGYVLDPSRYSLLAVVPQSQVDLVRTRTTRVELRSVDRVWVVLSAKIMREVPAASADLPSMALSLQGGGTIGLDPSASARGQTPKALSPLFQFELRFTEGAVPQALGNRVYVRFVHENEPLGLQWYRSLRQLFLKRLAV